MPIEETGCRDDRDGSQRADSGLDEPVGDDQRGYERAEQECAAPPPPMRPGARRSRWRSRWRDWPRKNGIAEHGPSLCPERSAPGQQCEHEADAGRDAGRLQRIAPDGGDELVVLVLRQASASDTAEEILSCAALARLSMLALVPWLGER